MDLLHGLGLIDESCDRRCFGVGTQKQMIAFLKNHQGSAVIVSRDDRRDRDHRYSYRVTDSTYRAYTSHENGRAHLADTEVATPDSGS